MEKETSTNRYKTDPRVLQMLAILYERNYIITGQSELFEKLLKELVDENGNSIV